MLHNTAKSDRTFPKTRTVRNLDEHTVEADRPLSPKQKKEGTPANVTPNPYPKCFGELLQYNHASSCCFKLLAPRNGSPQALGQLGPLRIGKLLARAPSEEERKRLRASLMQEHGILHCKWHNIR